MAGIDVVGAWYTDDPGAVVVEMADGDLAQFCLAPFRVVTKTELKPYTQAHPSSKKSLPVPAYLYRFYGLNRCAQL